MNRYEHLETAYYLHFHGRNVPSKSRKLKFINTDTRQRKGLSLAPMSKTGSGAHPASYPPGKMLFARGEADRS
jgi:hypothetical protein